MKLILTPMEASDLAKTPDIAQRRRGDIPVLHLGGRILVKRLELERMLGKPTASQARA